jgi:RimJ/RimL family protein N-acetyltransferase
MLVIRADQIATLARATRERLAREVVRGLRVSAPDAIIALSEAEIEARLQAALVKADRYELETVRDLQAFVKLCFQIGPNFDQYEPFQAVFMSRSISRMGQLFHQATDRDWIDAAVGDVVSRSRNAVAPVAAGEHAKLAFAGADRDERRPPSLVPLSLQHAEAYHRQALHPDVWRLANLQPLLRLDDVKHHIVVTQTDPNRDGFAIIDESAGFVGAMTIERDGPSTRMLYWVGRPFWGKGVATASVRRHIAVLRTTVRQVIADVFPGNAPSIRVLEKCGFSPEPARGRTPTRRQRYQIDFVTSAK